MSLANLQALEAAQNAPEETATETAPAGTEAPSSQEAPASTDTNNNAPTVDDASVDDLLKALDSVPSVLAPKEVDSTEKPAGGNPAPIAPIAPAASTTTDDDDDDDDEEVAAAPAPAQPIARNFRLHTDDPKLANFLKTLKSAQAENPNVNPAQVAALLGYSMPAATAAAVAAPAEAESEPSRPDPRVESLKQEVSTLEAELLRAKEAYEPTDEIVRKLAKKDRELERAEEDAHAQIVANQEYDAGYKAARAQAAALCPEAQDDSTTQYDLIIAEVQRIKRTSPEALDNPSYPLMVLQRVAAKHPTLFPNVVKKAAPAAAPAALAAPVAKPAKPGQPTSRPVGVVVPGATQGPVIDASNAKAALNDLSPDELIALADKSSALERRRKG